MIAGRYLLFRRWITFDCSCQSHLTSGREIGVCQIVESVELVTSKIPCTSRLVVATQPSQDRGCISVTVLSSDNRVSTEGADHLDSANGNQVVDPDVVALFHIEVAILAVIFTVVNTSLAIILEPGV